MPPSFRARVWIRRLAWVGILVPVVFGIRAWQQSDLAHGAAPELAGTRVDGIPYVLPRQVPRPTLVYFWASWCAVCRVEQGAIRDIATDHDVVVVALRSGTDAEVTRYLQSHGLRGPVLNDPDGRLAQRWGVRATPTFFVVDGAGNIRFREVGYTSAVGLRLRLWLAERI